MRHADDQTKRLGMSNAMQNRFAIVVIGETDYSRDSGRSEMMLALQAITTALDDAGIAPSEVDGLMTWRVDNTSEAEIAANLGVKDLARFGDINQSGNVRAPLVAAASAAISAGLPTVVWISQRRTARPGPPSRRAQDSSRQCTSGRRLPI